MLCSYKICASSGYCVSYALNSHSLLIFPYLLSVCLRVLRVNQSEILEGSQHDSVERCFFGGVGGGGRHAPGRQRESRAPARRDGADTAATSAALPCGAALFHFGTVPLGRYAACRRSPFACRTVVQLPPARSALPRPSAPCARRPILLSFTSSAEEPGLAGARMLLFSRGEKGKTT